MSPILDRGFDHASLTRNADDVKTAQAADIKVAKATKDPASIALTVKRAKTTDDRIGAAASALVHLEEIEAKHGAANARMWAAKHAVNAGTLDAAVAAADAAELAIASAAERFYANAHPAACAAVSQPLNAVVNSAHDSESRARNAVIEATLGYVATLFSRYSREDAVGYANAHGRSATAAQTAWWPIAELTAIAALVEMAVEASRLAKANRGAEPPTVADLEKCFSARRAGFESARAAARAHITALEAQIGKLT